MVSFLSPFLSWSLLDVVTVRMDALLFFLIPSGTLSFVPVIIVFILCYFCFHLYFITDTV